MNLPPGRFQEYPTAQAFQVEHGSVRSNQQGVNFDLGSNISVDWVDLKMLTMISSLVAISGLIWMIWNSQENQASALPTMAQRMSRHNTPGLLCAPVLWKVRMTMGITTGQIPAEYVV